MELTGALLTEVLEQVGIVWIREDGKAYTGFIEDVDLTPYIEEATIKLKERLNV